MPPNAEAVVVKTLAAAAAAAVLAVAPTADGARATEHASVSTLARGVLVQINDFRRAHGLRPMRLSDGLTRAATQHSAEMARLGYFAHESAGGGSFSSRVERYYPSSGAQYWSVGENLLWSSPTVDAADALQLWVNSAPHRENLLTARWREIGLAAVHVDHGPGVYRSQPVTILTADFGVRR